MSMRCCRSETSTNPDIHPNLVSDKPLSSVTRSIPQFSKLDGIHSFCQSINNYKIQLANLSSSTYLDIFQIAGYSENK